MSQLGFYIDITKCTGCKTCVVACKDKNDLEPGRNFRTVHAYEEGSWRQDRATGAWHQDVLAYHVPVSCNHCSDPAKGRRVWHATKARSVGSNRTAVRRSTRGL